MTERWVGRSTGRVETAVTLLEATGRTIHDTIPITSTVVPSEAAPLPVVAIEGRRTDFDLVGTIGEGGMGRVLLVRQRSLSRDVAVKTVKEGATASDHADLVREARISGSLEHPGIVPVHALGIDGEGRPLLVMKRVQGVNWEMLLRDAKHAAWDTVTTESGDHLDANLEILGRVCRALELAHSRGIIHRDVKPSNVMVGPFGEVYLVDWGIAASKGTSSEDAIVGTPTYMAPEMVAGEPIDERTDVYLLGAVLHRVLVGRPRNAGASTLEVLGAALDGAPFDYPSHVPSELATLCNRATAREPEARPSSVRVFREEVAAFARNRGAVALSDAALQRLDELEKALANAGKDAPPSDRVLAYRLATEARFGLLFCKRTYPDHAPASDGLDRCLRALVDLELRCGNVDAAAAALDDLARPDAELGDRVARAREAAIESSREHARLRALQHDLDASVSRGGRIGLFAGSTVSIVAIATTAMVLGRTQAPTDPLMVAYSVASLVASVVFIGVFRRHLFANAFNRRSVYALLALLVLNVAERALCVARGVPAQTMLTSELFSILAGVAMVVIFHIRRAALVLVPIAAGIVIMQATSVRPHLVMSITLIVTYAAGAWALSGGKAQTNQPNR